MTESKIVPAAGKQIEWVRDQVAKGVTAQDDLKEAFVTEFAPKTGQHLRSGNIAKGGGTVLETQKSPSTKKSSFDLAAAIEALKADFSTKLDGLKAQIESQAQTMDPRTMSGMELLKLAQKRLGEESKAPVAPTEGINAPPTAASVARIADGDTTAGA